MTRRVVQLTVAPESEAIFPIPYALCDDGTIWLKLIRPGEDWHQVKGVPQIPITGETTDD